MKRIIVWSSIAVLVAISLASYSQAAELRGLWVDAFNPGFKSPEETSAMVTMAKQCNFNALFVQVRRRGDVYYSSSIEPTANDLTPGYDALADVITKAHAVGMEVHAWISVYEVYHDTKESTPDPSQVHKRHPEWLMKDDRGETKLPGDKVYLDPGVPEVNAYLVSIVEELARSYSIDGIHLDIARYPGIETGYNDASVARFKQEQGRSDKPANGDAAWCNWRRSQVTQFVRTAYQTATAIKPQLKVSAAVFAKRADATGRCLQDWEGWVNAGIVDFVVPMAFFSDARVFQSTLDDLASLHSNRIYLGQGGYKMTAAEGVNQVSLARAAGASPSQAGGSLEASAADHEADLLPKQWERLRAGVKSIGMG